MVNGPELEELDAFFVESAEHSKLKTTIATKYFFTWARIIMKTARSTKIGYVDLYAGPGRFIDGTKSTPLLILERAIREKQMSFAACCASAASGAARMPPPRVVMNARRSISPSLTG